MRSKARTSPAAWPTWSYGITPSPRMVPPLPRRRFADRGSSRIAYETCRRFGRRAPWLVLIQGLGFDRSGWAPVIPALRRRFRLILIDNRGSGRSTTPDRTFTVADMGG